MDTRRLAGVTLVVGILTYRRLDQLALCLPEVVAQAEALEQDMVGRARVLVVDNDAAESARDYALGLAVGHPCVQYVCEPTPGIAAARQRCLAEAADADLLQFIDDDELPAPNWLASMVSTWAHHEQPAAVSGCVRPRFESTPSEFISAGQFFVRAEHPTGTGLPFARSGNLLIDIRAARELGVEFDTSLGLRGGEDIAFTQQLVARGGRIVACAEAIVYDLVPDERNDKSWVLRRAWHQGSTYSHLRLAAASGPFGRAGVRCWLVIGGTARVVVGLARAALGALTGSAARNARGLRLVWRGAGILRRAIGRTPPEYQRSEVTG